MSQQNPNDRGTARHPVRDGDSIRQKPVGYTEWPPEMANRQTASRGTGYRQPVRDGADYGNGMPQTGYRNTSFGQNPVPPATGYVNNRTYGFQPVNPAGPVISGPGPDPLIAEDNFENDDGDILKNRSTSMFSPSNPFWDVPDSQKKKKQKGAWKKVLAVTGVVLILTLIVLYTTVFRVRTVRIVGNQTVPAETISRLSGLHSGDSIFSLNEENVSLGINSNRYLIYEKLEIEWPSMVTIYIRERKAEAVMSYCGINYFIDHNGMVLEESSNIEADYGMVSVSGMSITSAGCGIGRTIAVSKEIQFLTMKELLLELKVLSLTETVSRVNLADLNNILVEMRQGYSVRLGDYHQLHAKLKSMKYTADMLTAMGQGNGTIDVSDPENPSFIPE